MEGINTVTLLGTLGADPELKVTTNGKKLLKLWLATNERYFTNNEWKEKTNWHSVLLWGDKRAESLRRLLEKGSNVFVNGSIQTSSYEKDGEKRYRTEVVANKIIPCGGKSGGNRDNGRQSGREPLDEEMPF